MTTPIVTVDQVTYRYPGQERDAVSNVSFHIKQGEWLAVVGHNGSGKSTMARLLNGLLLPTSGSICVNNQPLNEATIWEIRKHIGMVFQNPDNQFVGSTVVDDIAFGLENNGIPREIMIERIDLALTLVKMESFREQEPHQLSGGQKQRVAIAGVLALQPDLIILDEATSMLDPLGREEVLHTVRKLKEDGHISVLSITHDLEEAALADRVVVMNDGNVFAEGSPNEIFALDEKLVEIGLDLPFPVKVRKELVKQGIPVHTIQLTMEGLVHELCKLR